MKLITLSPDKSLDRAFLKQPINRNEIELFKTNLMDLIGRINDKESEEHHKNFVRDFLKDTFYKSDYEINTKGKQDLVIHTGKSSSDKVGVILEAKKPTNKSDMISAANPNRKALHELVLYFLRERIDEKNNDLKKLVITNINEWFIFDASVFNRLFFDNKTFVKEYEKWRDKLKTTDKTDLFYNEIAKPYIEKVESEIVCTRFDIRDYKDALENDDLKDDESLIELYKILSPHYLLKIPFADDSNKLDRNFYTELLHIIGLEETKDKNKLKIDRKVEERRNAGSLIENAVVIIETKDCLHKVKNLENYGATREERLFNVALELCLTWINRVLFLKLLEAQLVEYHGGDREYRFLDIKTISDFDELFTLFHQVLAKTTEDRTAANKTKYARVPYLNSSLFEISELEGETITIESLKDTIELPFNSSSILKDSNKKQNGLTTLEYLFNFLDAYDFASEGAETITENNRPLINASVLGKIFEKINNAKAGSIYTPGFITMYMCRQAIRLAVVQKFKDAYGWQIEEFADLKNYLTDRRTKADILEFNAVINSLRLCDPAVGSGHFLVSALNEIIAVKSELGILSDADGTRIQDVEITVENDELTVFDTEKSEFFKYQIKNGKPSSSKAQKLQKTMFHEKQTIIENCLFGVDIIPHSVKICRLRLWIELLKNAYYKESSGYIELETLPNIDINIKEGNSLVSRFALNADLSEVLSKVEYTIEDYQNFVLGYKETRDREKKREFERKIEEIKDNFRVELNHLSPERKQLAKLKNELFDKQSKQFLFGEDEDKQKKRLKRIEELKFDIDLQKQIIKEIEENRIYKNAFEWRFEFPEVLDNEGNFLGFDLVIGNPPYVFARENFDEPTKKYLVDSFKTSQYQINLFLLFIEKVVAILKTKGEFSLIVPNSFLMVSSAQKLRGFLLNETVFHEIINLIGSSFDGINVETIILACCKDLGSENNKVDILISNDQNFNFLHSKTQSFFKQQKGFELNVFSSQQGDELTQKLFSGAVQLNELVRIKAGLQAYEKGKGKPIQTRQDVIDRPYDYSYKFDETTFEYLDGKDVGRYVVNWKGAFLKYGENLAAPRTFDLFDGKKIIIREITAKHPHSIIATYTEDIYLFNRSNIAIVEKEQSEVSLKFILGILNSKLMSYYFMKNTAKAERAMFPKLILEDLRKFPIKQITPKAQQLFITIVDRILESKKQGKNVQALEDEIDRLVYRLYDLTAEEIAIVEGK